MTFKRFVSQNAWFSLALPVNWNEYDAEEENTYAFFNTSHWTGNLRITPYQLAEPVEPGKVGQFIEDEISNNEDATRIILGELDCAWYKKELLQDEEDDLLIYYWVGGKNENIFIVHLQLTGKKRKQKKISLS